MADVKQTFLMDRDLCAIARSWPLCARDGSDHVITTHCQLPNGSLVKVRIRHSGDGWIASDGGAALDEAVASGIERPAMGLTIRRILRDKGLSFVDGRIETPRVGEESLFNAVVVIANTAREISESLIYLGSTFAEDTLENRARKILVSRFHALVSAKPVILAGASEREHKFENVLQLPDGRKVLVDVARHQGNSINAAVVANLDIKRLENPNIIQRIVFDPSENWKNEEIALLGVGATPVALPSLGESIAKVAA